MAGKRQNVSPHILPAVTVLLVDTSLYCQQYFGYLHDRVSPIPDATEPKVFVSSNCYSHGT
jgi:hypothetical protein